MAHPGLLENVGEEVINIGGDDVVQRNAIKTVEAVPLLVAVQRIAGSRDRAPSSARVHHEQAIRVGIVANRNQRGRQAQFPRSLDQSPSCFGLGRQAPDLVTFQELGELVGDTDTRVRFALILEKAPFDWLTTQDMEGIDDVVEPELDCNLDHLVSGQLSGVCPPAGLEKPALLERALSFRQPEVGADVVGKRRRQLLQGDQLPRGWAKVQQRPRQSANL